MSGIKGSCNRPKVAKSLRSMRGKTFRNESPEALERYRKKIQSRSDRKQKKRRRKGR